MLTVGSLFSGIGGFDLGLERTGGFRTAWFCEQEPFCQHILAEHWPGVPCYDDVRAITAEHVQPVDVLCGGFPCQDLSYAGSGAGIDGERSGLWSEYARLVRELRPRYVVVENVSALLARGLGRVLGDLAAIGYDAEWDCIPASAVGAPHRRDRIWLVAYPNGRGCEVGGEPHGRPEQSRQQAPQRRDADGLRAVVADSDEQRCNGRTGDLGPRRRAEPAHGRCNGSDADCAGLEGHGDEPRDLRASSGEVATGGIKWWAAEPDVGRVADGVPARVDRLKALGNALVPQIAEWLGLRILEYEAREGGRLADAA